MNDHDQDAPVASRLILPRRRLLAGSALAGAWLAQARAQDQLGWATPVSLDSARRVVIGVPGVSFAAKGTAHHPLGRAADVALAFVTDGQGRLVSTAPLPAGRWQVRLDISSGRDVKRLMEVLA